MKDDYFGKNTRFHSVGPLLEARYGGPAGGNILRKAGEYLKAELAELDGGLEKTVRKHMVSTVLPGYSLYRAMLDCGIGQDAAIEILEGEMCRSAEQKGRFMGTLGRLPFAYPLMRLIFRTVTRLSYPPEGWAVSFGRADSERLEVFISSCLYCREFEKRGYPELGRAFCKTDHIVYLPLAPNIVFSQEGTLAKGCARCDFVFSDGKSSAR